MSAKKPCNPPRERIGKILKDGKTRACAIPCELLAKPKNSTRTECQQYAKKGYYSRPKTHKTQAKDDLIVTKDSAEQDYFKSALGSLKNNYERFEDFTKSNKISVKYENSKRFTSVSYETLQKNNKPFILAYDDALDLKNLNMFMNYQHYKNDTNLQVYIYALKLRAKIDDEIKRKLETLTQTATPPKLTFLFKHIDEKKEIYKNRNTYNI